MCAIFQKKGKKRAIYLKIWAKICKISKYFEKGQERAWTGKKTLNIFFWYREILGQFWATSTQPTMYVKSAINSPWRVLFFQLYYETIIYHVQVSNEAKPAITQIRVKNLAGDYKQTSKYQWPNQTLPSYYVKIYASTNRNVGSKNQTYNFRRSKSDRFNLQDLSQLFFCIITVFRTICRWKKLFPSKFCNFYKVFANINITYFQHKPCRYYSQKP